MELLLPLLAAPIIPAEEQTVMVATAGSPMARRQAEADFLPPEVATVQPLAEFLLQPAGLVARAAAAVISAVTAVLGVAAEAGITLITDLAAEAATVAGRVARGLHQ